MHFHHFNHENFDKLIYYICPSLTPFWSKILKLVFSDRIIFLIRERELFTICFVNLTLRSRSKQWGVQLNQTLQNLKRMLRWSCRVRTKQGKRTEVKRHSIFKSPLAFISFTFDFFLLLQTNQANISKTILSLDNTILASYKVLAQKNRWWES